MTKPQLRLLAVVLGALIVIVLFAGLDDLPRSLRNQIAAEQQSLSTDAKDFQRRRDEVLSDLRADPDLFRVHSMNTALPARLARADSDLQAARKDMDALAALAKANRRRDGDRVGQLLRHERGLRAGAAAEASAVDKEAQRWLNVKKHLPDQVAQMQRDYQAARAADLTSVTTVVKKAESDWPAKKSDLETRLAALASGPAEAEKTWQSTAPLRARVASNDLAGFDYAALIAAADSLHQAGADLPARTKALESQTGQLYDSWDKILVDLETRRSGLRRHYNEKIRTVRTHFVDVPSKKAETRTDDQWVDVSEAQYRAVENNLGMAIEHKDAGKYDSEADRVAQPAGFAYIASPTQGSNQYGYWVHRDGASFWTWFPQYLLLRDLLYARDYRPLTTGEWEQYRTYRSTGRTYYGYEQGSSEPKYGTQGTFTQRRYADSNYARSGGYRDSRYATGGGSYRGSRYESRGAQSGQSSEPRTFGRSGGSAPRMSPRSAPPPRSSPRPGRSFGGRRR